MRRWHSVCYCSVLNAGCLQVYLFRNLTYGDVCASVQEQSSDGSGPTHIVASITYGMNAIMIFEKVTGSYGKMRPTESPQVVSESESQEQVGGQLSIAVNSIPGFSISGEGEINMDETNKEFYESITCKVHILWVIQDSKIFLIRCMVISFWIRLHQPSTTASELTR